MIRNSSQSPSDTSPDLTQEQIDQVEYLIQQSMRGHHVLFDLETVRRALSPGAASELTQELTEDRAILVESHIEALLREPTLSHKREYLEHLDPQTHAWVVRTYFNIIETNLYETQEVHH